MEPQLKLPACNNRTDLEALHLQNDCSKQNSVYILDWTVFFEVLKKKKKLWSNANILPAPTPFSNPRVQNVDFAKTFCRDPRRTSIPSVIICSTSFHTFPFFSYDTACKPMTTFSKHSWKTLGPGKGCHFKMGQSNLSTNDPGKGSLHVTLVPMLIHVESQHKSDAMFQHVRCWWSTKWILWSWKIITNIDSLQKALHITSFPILQKKSEGRCITCVCVCDAW